MDDDSDNTVDVFGFGKIATAIPKKVYERVAFASVSAIENLIAPITETTGGLGRYLHQKFANMVEAEKALGAFALEQAIARAREEAAREGLSIVPPKGIKTFVKSIEEASRESDPLLHEMWTNLIASQILEDSEQGHPYYVATLSNLGRQEALLFLELLAFEELGTHGGGYLGGGYDGFKLWMRNGTSPALPWTVSCTLLVELGLAKMVAPPTIDKTAPENPLARYTTILHRTRLGVAFFRAISPPTD